jgi:hypothetical protein
MAYVLVDRLSRRNSSVDLNHKLAVRYEATVHIVAINEWL